MRRHLLKQAALSLLVMFVGFVATLLLEKGAERTTNGLLIDLALVIAPAAALVLAVRLRTTFVAYLLGGWVAFYAIHTIQRALYGPRSLPTAPDKIGALVAVFAGVVMTLALSRMLRRTSDQPT